jgi:uncharacterized delta-60 repeat protein
MRQVTVLLLALVGVALAAEPAWSQGGDLDPSFSGDGATRADFASDGYDSAFGVVIQPNGVVVVAGVGGIPNHFALARFHPNGVLDGTFGGDGKVETDFATATESADDVAVQPNHRILAVGVASDQQGKFAVARYRADGHPDTDFSGDGRLRTGFGTGSGATATAVALQPDRKIVVAGSGGGMALLARYQPDGTLDPSFGAGGKVMTGGLSANDVAVLGDGRILIAGSTGPKFAVGRYLPDGSIDPSFGTGGVATAGFGTDLAYAEGIAIQPDEKLVAAGATADHTMPLDVAVARFSADGDLDGSFGAGGRVVTDLGGEGGDWGQAVGLEPDGRIVVAGTTHHLLGPCASGHEITVLRYDADGALDQSFGVGGVATTSLSETDDGNDVAIQVDGRIVVAGFTGGYCDNNRFVAARYLAE